MWRVACVGGYGEQFQLLRDVVNTTNHNDSFYLELFLGQCHIAHWLQLAIETRRLVEARFKPRSSAMSTHFRLWIVTYHLDDMATATLLVIDCETCPCQWHLSHDFRVDPCVQLQARTSTLTG